MVEIPDPMTNKTRGLIPLPAGDVPAETQCITLCIPAGEHARRQLFGALYEFTHWNNWQRDDDHKGTLWAQAWRAAIMEGMLNCFMYRINGGVPQFSSDGGATWTNVPAVNDGTTGYEPQHDEPTLPARTGSNKPCLAAANAVAVFVELHREVVEWYNNGAVVIICLGALALALGVLFPVSWAVFGLSLSAVTLATVFLTHTAVLNMASFDTTVQERLACILYCHADSNGQWNASTFANILTDIDAESGEIWELIRYYVNDIAGLVGLNNAGTTTSVETYDCSGCGCVWCRLFNYLLDEQGWAANVNGGFNPSVLAQYIADWQHVVCQGVEYPNNYWTHCYIHIDCPRIITKVRIYYALDPGNNTYGIDPRILLYDESGLFQEWDNVATSGYVEWTGSRNIATITVGIEAAFRSDSTPTTGQIHVSEIEIWGEGTNPYGADNCS